MNWCRFHNIARQSVEVRTMHVTGHVFVTLRVYYVSEFGHTPPHCPVSSNWMISKSNDGYLNLLFTFFALPLLLS